MEKFQKVIAKRKNILKKYSQKIFSNGINPSKFGTPQKSHRKKKFLRRNNFTILKLVATCIGTTRKNNLRTWRNIFSGTIEMCCFGAIQVNDQKIILNFFRKKMQNMEQ